MAKIELVYGTFFRWNLTNNVGRKQPNQHDDVELVRFGYFCAFHSPLNATLRIRLFAELRVMRTSGPYGDDLQNVIDAHQKLRGGTQDGTVSVAKPTVVNRERYDGEHIWIMDILDTNLRDMVAEYPRLDQHARCGPVIGASVKKLFNVQ